MIEVWQDGCRMIDTLGHLLVLAGAMSDSLEVGITASNEQTRWVTLSMNDVAIFAELFAE